MRLLFLNPILFLLMNITFTVFSQAPSLYTTQVISGLSLPMQIVNAGDGSNRLFIVEKAGAIKVFNSNYILLDNFLTVSDIRSSENERGLLSMAFHPDYKNNGFFYVYYTNSAGNLEVDRYRVSANANKADDTSKDTLIIIPHPVNDNHNGGELHFGNDGYLYLSTGDGGGGNDVPNNAQTTTVLLGKILRFNVNTSDVKPYYTLPPDNPFGNEVFAYGLRNPFRWSFDRLTHDMWIGDVGQDASEEVNFSPAGTAPGVNYGWRCYEASIAKNLNGCGSISNYTFPIYTFPTTAAASVAITGGTVYRGSVFLDLQGYYLACEYYTGNYFKIKSTGLNTWDTSTQKLATTGISDFGESEDGEIYISGLGTGRIFRLQASGARQYKFTGNGLWTMASNWLYNAIPPAVPTDRSEIIIDPPPGSECIVDVPVTIPAGIKFIVNNNKQLRVTGDLKIN